MIIKYLRIFFKNLFLSILDFAGGSFTCAMGIMAALFERSKSGLGQIIDANMVEGAAYVGSWIYLSQVHY